MVTVHYMANARIEQDCEVAHEVWVISAPTGLDAVYCFKQVAANYVAPFGGAIATYSCGFWTTCDAGESTHVTCVGMVPISQATYDELPEFLQYFKVEGK